MIDILSVVRRCHRNSID